MVILFLMTVLIAANAKDVKEYYSVSWKTSMKSDQQ